MISTAQILSVAEKNYEYIVKFRRQFHSNPELSMKEYQTAAAVREELDRLGIRWIPVGETGTVGVIEGNGSSQEVVAIRGDMDALEVEEKTGLEYASKNPGISHACGHDAHTAMLLGAAKIFSDLGFENIPGKVYLIFQPGEELGFGAREMVTSGVLDDTTVFFGEHMWALSAEGSVCCSMDGPIMAGAKAFLIRVFGKSGHGSAPHLANNPVVPVLAIANAILSISYNEIPPKEAFVLSVNEIQVGSRFNVIADEGLIGGNIRFYNDESGNKAFKRIEEISKQIGAAFGVTVEVILANADLPALVAHPDANADLRKAAEKIYGKEKMLELGGIMGSEDFALYKQIAPCAFAGIGVYNKEAGCIYSQHSPSFRFNEQTMLKGAALYVAFAMERFGRK